MSDLSAGDMVITPKGLIGLLSHVTPAGMAAIRFGQNVQLHYHKAHLVRRATRAEVDASSLRGVGCNQANDP